jgi:Zn-finger nucleic acid-binding protein
MLSQGKTRKARNVRLDHTGLDLLLGDEAIENRAELRLVQEMEQKSEREFGKRSEEYQKAAKGKNENSNKPGIGFQEILPQIQPPNPKDEGNWRGRLLRRGGREATGDPHSDGENEPLFCTLELFVRGRS